MACSPNRGSVAAHASAESGACHRDGWKRMHALILAALVLEVGIRSIPVAAAVKLDKMDLDRWTNLREAERYQLTVAERYYKQGNWKAALAEYEKFVTLYERSEGASFAQLKWGLCQVQLRQANTAIKDGFQTVIDYWPDSPDAVVARYYVGHTYKEMGQVDKAKKAYALVVKQHATENVGILALADLLDIARTQHDQTARGQYLKTLTFDVKRSGETRRLCAQAARQYAAWCFERAAVEEGANALATDYTGSELFAQVASQAWALIEKLAAEDATRAKAIRMTADGVAWCQTRLPKDPSSEAAKSERLAGMLAMVDLYAASGQTNRVVELYRDIESRCGTSDIVRGHRAAWHERLGQFEQAYQIYRQFDNAVDGRARVALSYRQRNLPKPAVEVYLQLADLEPGRRAHWLSEIASTRRAAGQFDEAIKVYRQLLADDPGQSSQWLWQIGTTHRDARQWKEAIGVLRQCSNFPQHLMVMATCHRHLKQYHEALLLYQQIGADPAYAAWAAYQIAATWEEAGAKENAIKAFRHVCQQFPKTSQASAAHARLQSVYNISVTLGGALDK